MKGITRDQAERMADNLGFSGDALTQVKHYSKHVDISYLHTCQPPVHLFDSVMLYL